MTNSNFELLSPAGDLERVRTALHFGADAVYVGGPKLHLRASAVDFSLQTLQDALALVHSVGKKLYVTVNAFARNRDFDELPAYAQTLHAMGVDAVIVADLGVLMTIKQVAPLLPVHISTQANCVNYKTAQTYHDLGASRIVLGREMTLSEIAELRQKTPTSLELEVFVHGAMCMAYSGRCLLSAYMTGRSGNRGDCAQPCRWNYALVEEQRPGEYFPIQEDAGGTAILSSRDLCAISLLPQLMEIGVHSYKIEGRMKSPYYVATVTNAYRHALDGTADPAVLENELLSASHRQYSTGFYLDEIKHLPPHTGPYLQDSLFIGVVEQCADGRILLEQRNRFSVGETLEILSPHSLGRSFEVKGIWDAEGNALTCASRVQQKVWITCPYELSPMDILRRRKM